MRLTGLEVNNYGTFKHAKIDLDHKGITTIFGLNRDAASTSGGQYTNASGKSLLFTAIPEAAFGSPPSGRDSVKHTKSSIKLEFRHDKDVIVFDKQYGKSKKFVITKNGKDTNSRKLDYCQKKLQAYLGTHDEEDFYTSRYIDNTLPHPLITGKPDHRQKFFVKLFRLENVDAMRQLLNAELRDIQKAKGTYTELLDMFTQAKKTSLTKIQIQEKTEELEVLKEVQVQLLERMNKYQVVRDLVSFEDSQSKLLKRFKSWTSVDTFKDDFKALRVKRKHLQQAIEQATEWQEYEVLKDAYDEAKVKAESTLGKLGFENQKRSELSLLLEDYTKASGKLGQATADLDNLDLDKPEKVEDPGIDVNSQQLKVLRLGDEHKTCKTFKEGKCPTCGAPFKGRSPEEVKDKLDKAKAKLAKAQAYETYIKARSVYKENKAKADGLELEINRLEKRVKELSKVDQALKALDKVPKKPEKPEGDRPSKVKILRSELDEITERLERFRAFNDVFENIEACDNLTDKDRTNAKKLNGFTDKIGETNNRINVLTADITSGKQARKQLKDLALRGEALKGKVEDEPIVKTLIDAYSKKGIKKLLIKRYASVLSDQINKFTRLFFAEDITFELRFESKLEFLFHKVKTTGKKKTTLTLDVKRLSGAEKRMLTLVLIVATLSMQPKNKRSNLLILDEPEANMGPEALNTFSKAILSLTKIIPHIVIITPRPELDIEGSRIYTVVKRNGVSTIVQGKAK